MATVFTDKICLLHIGQIVAARAIVIDKRSFTSRAIAPEINYLIGKPLPAPFGSMNEVFDV